MTSEPGGAVPLRDRAARREALLDAADRIVRRDGPAASMTTIAAEAGITKPILYRHFGDKSGLYAALADRYTGNLLVDLRAALAAGTTRRDRLARGIDAYLAAIEDEPQVYRFLVHSDEAAGAQSEVRTFTRRLGALLAEGIGLELDVPGDGVRAQAWAHGIVGMVQAAGDWWLDARPCPRAELVAELADLVGGAYAGPAGGSDALAAHQAAVLLRGQLAAVVDQEAAAAGELVALLRQHPDGELLPGQVGTGQLERLVEVGLVDVDRAGLGLRPARLELLEAVLADLVGLGASRLVVVGGHAGGPLFLVQGSGAGTTRGEPGLCPSPLRRRPTVAGALLRVAWARGALDHTPPHPCRTPVTVLSHASPSARSRRRGQRSPSAQP